MQALTPDHHNFIYALHGFLGESSDWIEIFNNHFEDDHIACPSYFSDFSFTHLLLDTFVEDINNHLDLGIYGQKIFIGYSLGGRIGLRLLEEFPDLFDHYIFVSTHFGLSNEFEKENRIKSDQKWIDTLLATTWTDFLSQWNHQDVLKKSVSIERSESAFNKDRIKTALLDFSLGHQKNYSDLIAEHQNRITWVVGDQDLKFLDLAEQLKKKNSITEFKKISAGHRILSDNPKQLSQVIKTVLSELKQKKASSF